MKDIESNYIREFEATVTKVKDDYVVLDRTAFYPLGGGQPSDSGWLLWDRTKKARVREVTKKGIVKHHLEPGGLDEQMGGEYPEAGQTVMGVLDWDLRYGRMRMHTAQHIMSGIAYDEFGSRTVGNQLYHDKARVDLSPSKLEPEDMQLLEDKCNDLISRNVTVKITETERCDLEKRVDTLRANLDLLPQSVTNLRVVEVSSFDVCPCAGTHVRNTSELGRVRIIKKENKGKDRERIIYTLE